jgi:hypothetical protein
LEAGEELMVPAGMRHDWWNAGDGDAGVLVELSPPQPRFKTMIATLFGLANAGTTNAKGLPGPLQLALIAREFSDVIRFTKPPRPCRECCSRSSAPQEGCAVTAPSIPSTCGRTAASRRIHR